MNDRLSPARHQISRGLDANFNRLSEALRTVEDRLRFDLARPASVGRWKALRLQVGALRQKVEADGFPLALARDVANDPGAPGPDSPSPARASLDDVLRANLARARESSRSIEESLRVLDDSLAREAELIRYAIYHEEPNVIRNAASLPTVDDVRLYVLVTTSLASRSAAETTQAAVAGGAQMIQLREKELPKRELLSLARDLREITSAGGARLIINDSVDIAALCDADGVHLGQDDLPVSEARRILGPKAIVGVSTHDPGQALRAEQDGANYIGVGPIFLTQTKEHRAAVGLDFIRAAREAVDIPGFAIGNVNRETFSQVLEAGARHVAICTGVIAADDIEGAARWFSQQLEGQVAAG